MAPAPTDDGGALALDVLRTLELDIAGAAMAPLPRSTIDRSIELKEFKNSLRVATRGDGERPSSDPNGSARAIEPLTFVKPTRGAKRCANRQEGALLRR